MQGLMIFTSFDRTQISYRFKKGKSPCLLFVHGWANNWTTWKQELAFFEKKGYATLTLDLRGHGESDKPEGKEKYHLECFAKDIHELIKITNVRQIVLIGHSMGGMIALTFYKLFNHANHRVKGIVLADTTCRNVLEHKAVKVLSPFIRHVLDFLISYTRINKEHFKHMKDVDLSKYKKASDYRIFYEGLHNTPLECVFACFDAMIDYDCKAILNKINVPVLIIEGKKDSLLPLLDSKDMYEELTDAEMKCINCRHMANVDAPRAVERHILNFLEKHVEKRKV